MQRCFLLTALMLCSAASGAHADDLSICYNYGCARSAGVHLHGAQLSHIHMLLAWVDNAEEERQAIAQAIGLFQTAAGQQTPTFRDRGRNIPDEGADGRMDCIDHAHNTSAYLRLMEERGWLNFHRVLEPVKRAPWIFNEHWSARIAEKDSGEEFVVDSWFFDNGHPAAIFTLEEWMKGAEPNE
ncbi:MAG: hypothetical protein C3F18_01970 [Nitrosomonadales bacterium]|nr:MAG: hypothetical protein C3F18_01970 [Nitrosomonadales bacterium]